MHYSIVYDKNRRLRARLNITLPYGTAAGLTTLLLGIEGVTKAEVTPINGGMLIYYKQGARERILNFISALKKCDIP
ncbi:MAG: hypothetical protein IJR59_02320, partial [Firmicutes bacterium]|nr:hypothetical protein [Bacillota bacterium]